MRNWEGHKVLIIGAARQGTALARYLVTHGAHVIINDQKKAEELGQAKEALSDLSASGYSLEWVSGGHPLELLAKVDFLFVSGGVPLDLPLVAEARSRGIPILNDSQIFLEDSPCKVIGITGSAGKTTTTALLGRIAQAACQEENPNFFGNRVWVGGNIGTPLITFVEQIKPDDLAIMELSSFQLEIMTTSPHVAAILNVTPNHLDRHESMEAYESAKARILKFQTKSDFAVLGRDDPGAWSLSSQAKGIVFSFGLTTLPESQNGTYLSEDGIYLHVNEKAMEDIFRFAQEYRETDFFLMPLSAIELRGTHNLLNVMAACTIAGAMGISSHAMRVGVEGFKGVPHRLAYVRSWGGADWYNDSIATTPERAIAAIQSFLEPLILLVGGRDKKLPWDEFSEVARRRVDHMILFGEATDVILKGMSISGKEGFTVTRCAGLFEAVQAAAKLVKPGYVVLLAPGCTSFDEFKDFEERGECFSKWVKELV